LRHLTVEKGSSRDGLAGNAECGDPARPVTATLAVAILKIRACSRLSNIADMVRRQLSLPGHENHPGQVCLALLVLTALLVALMGGQGPATGASRAPARLICVARPAAGAPAQTPSALCAADIGVREPMSYGIGWSPLILGPVLPS
jgi:hypothetical protein